jgi:transketolase
MRDAFFETLERLMGSDKKIIFITADLGFKLFDRIAARYPDRVINVGIREATMIGIAAGLSKEGFLPFVYSIVPFVTLRCVEQIRVDLCYNNLSAVLVGVGSGLAYGPNGPTHMGIEDIGVMSALPNLTILSPCDAVEVRILLPQAIRLKTPVYLRLARTGEPLCHHSNTLTPKVGCPSMLKEGTDAAVVTYGAMVYEVLTAVNELEKEKGCSIRVISWHTLKPLKEKWILPLVKDNIPVMVIEEQMSGGSLGSQLALFLKERAIQNPFDHLHLPDEYPNICGDREYLLGRSKLSKTHIKRRIKKFLIRCKTEGTHKRLIPKSEFRIEG